MHTHTHNDEGAQDKQVYASIVYSYILYPNTQQHLKTEDFQNTTLLSCGELDCKIYTALKPLFTMDCDGLYRHIKWTGMRVASVFSIQLSARKE